MPVFRSCEAGYPNWNNNDYIPSGVEIDFSPNGALTSPNTSYIQAILAAQGITWQGFVSCFENFTGPMDGIWRVIPGNSKMPMEMSNT